MKRSIRPLVTTAVLIATLTTISFAPAGAASRAANRLQDGEFELRIPNGDAARRYEPGTALGAWRVQVATVAVGKPVSGIVSGISGRKQQFLFLKDPYASSAASVGRVCQRLALDPNASYRVRFYSAAVSANDVLIVVWKDSAVGQLTESGSMDPTDWQLHTIDLGSGNGTTGKLCFTGAGEGFPVVDAVTLLAS